MCFYGYHGETVGALSVGDLPLYGSPYRALCFPVQLTLSRLSGVWLEGVAQFGMILA